MAYNNYFPIGYQPMYPQYAPQGTQGAPDAYMQQAQANTRGMNQSAQSGIIWVQGEAGAKAYPVAPNTTVQLWDSENQVIYLKSADASGMPSMKTLDYTIRDAAGGNNALKQDMSIYITRDEFEEALEKLREVKRESTVSAVRKQRKYADDDEALF